jgi:hypothetical protein
MPFEIMVIATLAATWRKLAVWQVLGNHRCLGRQPQRSVSLSAARGCSYGCRYGHRGEPAEFTRESVYDCGLTSEERR